MKKRLLALFSLVAVLLASSCSKAEFKLRGEGLPERITEVKVIDQAGEVVETITVTNGAFTYTQPVNTETAYNLLFGDNEQLASYFTMEQGEFVVGMKEGDDGEFTIGMIEYPVGSQYAAYKTYAKEKDEVLGDLPERFEAALSKLGAAYEAEEKDMEAIEALNAEVRNLAGEINKTLTDFATKKYVGNENTLIGLDAFMYLDHEGEQALIDAFDAAGEMIKKQPRYVEQYEEALKVLPYSVGGTFTDVEMTAYNEEGEELSLTLSEFRNDDKYLLIDFFASWCGPCQASMPKLTEIYETYGDQVDVISIATWDKTLADYQGAVKDHNIVWTNFWDKESVAASEYAVAGVPTFILVNPAGEIILRGHDVDAVAKMLEELL